MLADNSDENVAPLGLLTTGSASISSSDPPTGDGELGAHQGSGGKPARGPIRVGGGAGLPATSVWDAVVTVI
jgi:hypothetical protein